MTMDINEIEAAIEGLLFASGEALGLERIAEILEMDKKSVKGLLNHMMDKCMASDRGIMIREVDSTYLLCTKPAYAETISRLFERRQRPVISQAAFETLAIIAYRQPVTRTRIEAIRGVNSDSALTKLMDRNLIREAGRLDAPGKPILYETTDEFLLSFGFKSIGELPVISMNEEEAEEQQETV